MSKFLKACVLNDLNSCKTLFSETCKDDKLSCLMIACNNGYIDIVNFLLDFCVDINSKDESGNTPIMNACNRCQVDTVKLLIGKN